MSSEMARRTQPSTKSMVCMCVLWL